MNNPKDDPQISQSDKFPIGLIIISFQKNHSTFHISSINQFAKKLFKIPQHSTDIISDFITRTKSYQQYLLNASSIKTLYDTILSTIQSSNSFISDYSIFICNDETISVKIQRNQSELFITVDDFSEEKKSIRKKLISSIRNNFLMTINHELRNYICTLITTLEDIRINTQSKDYATICATVNLIRKVIKLYTLFTKVSFDDLSSLDLKLETEVDLYKMAYRIQHKFRGVFDYKNLQMFSIEALKKIVIKTDASYMKNFIFVLFFFLYYKVTENATISMEITYPQPYQCVITFSDKINMLNNISNASKDLMFDDGTKMNEDHVKKSVMTMDILEYLLESIGKYLNIGVDLTSLCYFEKGGMNSKRTMKSNLTNTSQNKGNMKIISLTFNNIVIDDKAKYDTQLAYYNHDPNNKSVCVGHNSLNTSNYTMIEFPFEKKNTYDKTVLYDRLFKTNTTKSLNNVSTMSKSENPNTNNNSRQPNYVNCQGNSNNNNYEKIFFAFENDKKDNMNLGIAMKSAKFLSGDQFIMINSGFDSSSSSSLNESNNDDEKIKRQGFIARRSNNLTSFQNIPDDLNNNDNEKYHIILPNTTSNDIIPVAYDNFNDDCSPISKQKGDHNPNFKSTNKIKRHSNGEVTNKNEGNSQSPYRKFPRNKKVSNTLTVNNPFSPSDTVIFKGSICQKISNIVSIEENVRKVLEEVTLLTPTPTCNCNDIAIVDDDHQIANSLIKILNSQNYETDYCNDGKVCIEKILSKQTCTCKKRFYKLILLDVYMPEMGGITTCEKINELIVRGTIPSTVNVVFISGHKWKDLQLTHYDFIKGFYQKPINKATIVKILREYYE